MNNRLQTARQPRRGEMVYVSIPITGLNEIAQRAMAADITAMLGMVYGLIIINPFDLADELRKTLGREPTHAEFMKVDLVAMRPCQHIFLCCGWQNSTGCMQEVHEALRLKLNFIYQKKYHLC